MGVINFPNSPRETGLSEKTLRAGRKAKVAIEKMQNIVFNQPQDIKGWVSAFNTRIYEKNAKSASNIYYRLEEKLSKDNFNKFLKNLRPTENKKNSSMMKNLMKTIKDEQKKRLHKEVNNLIRGVLKK